MLIDKNEFKERFIEKLESTQGATFEETSLQDKYSALSALVREYVYKNWAKTNEEYRKEIEKEVYYFSIEFLFGRLLGKNLLNLGIERVCREALEDLNIRIEDLLDIESDLGLGNGGLGRLAACFLDSMASLNLSGHGCGIRYKYGLFEQKIINGYQVEVPDNWLKDGNIWEIRKADKAVEVRFGGTVEIGSISGRMSFIHKDYEPVLAVPYDIPITGYRNNTVNTLRLWSAEALIKDFDYASFNRGDYTKAVEYKHSVEAISEVLYPDDSYYNNKVLRLKQQYFFVSAGLQSIIKRYKKKSGNLEDLPEKISIHINDTHPALAIPELMRILVDEEAQGLWCRRPYPPSANWRFFSHRAGAFRSPVP
jgi:starch phosphorylase